MKRTRYPVPVLGRFPGLVSWVAVQLGRSVGLQRRRRVMAWLGLMRQDDPEFLQELEDTWAGKAKPSAVDRIDRPTPEVFYERYARHGIPVIITDLAKEWPIMQLNWSGLREQYGQMLFEVRSGGDYDGMRRDSMTLSDYIDAVERGEQLYIANNSLPASLRPAVQRPPYLDQTRYSDRGIRLWIGGSGSGAHLHRDLTDNFIVTVLGHKRVVLCAPDQTPRLYSWEVHSALGSCKFSALHPDYKRHPAAKDVKFLDVSLNPGDALYIPCGWYHQVENLDLVCSLNFFLRDSFAELSHWQSRRDAERRVKAIAS